MHCINIGLVTSLCLLELLAIIVLSNAVNYDGKFMDNSTELARSFNDIFDR